jgi:Do/DeqQ family serine protease
MWNKRTNLIIIPSLLATLALSGCSGAPALSLESTPLTLLKSNQAKPIAISAPASVEAVAAVEGALENIYTKVNPSVVSIQVSQKASDIPLTQIPGFPAFPFFFGDPQNPGFPQQRLPQEQYRHGAGSGFVWDKEGHIVTNSHVVDGADKIRVTFADGSSAEAEVVGADPDSDLAVLKVDVPAERLQPVEVTDSSQVKVGQLAVAIGNPFTLENTMTVGIISALGRQLPVGSSDAQSLTPVPSYTIPDIIQTDAPINPGNSGGVLVNDQGQVIGVTAAIESPVRANAGIGFAIPANIVQKVVPDLIKSGKYEHPWLGLSGTSLNPDLAQAMDLKAEQRGALVIDVTPGSPADQAGLRGSDREVQIEGQPVRVGGDVVTAINGQPVQDFDDLVAYLAGSTEIGQTVKLTVWRDGKEETISTTLAARPTADTQRDQSEPEIKGGVWLGIQGLNLSPAIAEKLDLPAEQKGVLVEQVEVNSPADEAGLRGSYKPTTIGGEPINLGGDIITAVDRQPVKTVSDLQKAIQQAEPGQKITLTVLREGKSVEVTVTLAEQPATPVS